MFKANFLCFLFIFALEPSKNYAMTPEQKAMIHEYYESIGAECIKESPLTGDDVNNLRAKQMPTGDGASCFLACMMKTASIIDDKGMLNKENAVELAKKVFNDPEELKAIENYFNSCSGINNEPVSDGEKGCERAMKAYKCMVENASQFGFDL